MRYKKKRVYRWDSGIAYAAGLMASDGCLANNFRHIILTSKDLEIIRNTQVILGKESIGVRTKTGQFGTSAYHLQFSDVSLYDFLLTAGITPAKSKTIQKVELPNEFYADFLRGYFDGDGTVYGYKDPRWKNSHMYYVGFASASYEFLVWMREQNMRLLGTAAGKIKNSTRVYVLTYAKSDSQLLFLSMHHDHSAPRLTRKYEKFAGFITPDPYAKIPLERASAGTR